MKVMTMVLCTFGALVCLYGCGDAPGPADPFVVLDGTALAPGFDIILNTNRGRADWISKEADSIRAAYPNGQDWGFVAVVVAGTDAGGGRPGRDMSGFTTMEIDLRGESGKEVVDLGIKDKTDPDTGEEKKKRLTLSSGWQTFSFRLSDFTTAELKTLNLLVELVFLGNNGQTVFFKNLRYLP